MEDTRRQNFKSIETVIGNMDFRTTRLAKLLGENFLVDRVVLDDYRLSVIDPLG